jgi:hypothetical protein
MKPFQAAYWLMKFGLSLALMLGLVYAGFLVGAGVVGYTAQAYQEYKEARYAQRVEACVKRNTEHPLYPRSEGQIREACDSLEAQ